MPSYLIRGSELCSLGTFAALLGTSSYVTYRLVKHFCGPCLYGSFDCMMNETIAKSTLGLSTMVTFAAGCLFLKEAELTLNKPA